MRYMFILALIFTGWLIMQSGCTNDNEEDLFPGCDSTNISYSSDITQILQANRCYNCHNSEGVSYNGVIVDNYDGLKAVVDDDRFYNVIHHTPGYTPMPYDGGKIDDCSLAKIREWIRDGAPEN